MIGCYPALISYPMFSVEGKTNDRTFPRQIRLCVLQGRGADQVNDSFIPLFYSVGQMR